MTEKDIYNRILIECCSAYSDCNSRYGLGPRDLAFKASSFVTVEEAVSILEEALCEDVSTPPSYNGFNPDLLMNLPKGSLVRIAREGSVCVYVKNTKLSLKQMNKLSKEFMHIDEIDIVDDTYRLWWD